MKYKFPASTPEKINALVAKEMYTIYKEDVAMLTGKAKVPIKRRKGNHFSYYKSLREKKGKFKSDESHETHEIGMIEKMEEMLKKHKEEVLYHERRLKEEKKIKRNYEKDYAEDPRLYGSLERSQDLEIQNHIDILTQTEKFGHLNNKNKSQNSSLVNASSIYKKDDMLVPLHPLEIQNQGKYPIDADTYKKIELEKQLEKEEGEKVKINDLSSGEEKEDIHKEDQETVDERKEQMFTQKYYQLSKKDKKSKTNNNKIQIEYHHPGTHVRLSLK
jgi:hypothetical protein